MSHVRKNSGCLPPDPKRLKLYESFQGAIQTEEINKSDLAKQYKSLNAAKSVNWAQGLDLLHTISDIESVYQTDAISDLGSVNMVGPIPAEGANQAEGIADLQGEFEMIDLDEALRPIDEFESSADVETGWEFIQQVLSQQKAVQEEIIPEQTGDFYSGPLFAPRPVYVPYKSRVNLHPRFAALVVNNEVTIPGLNVREGNYMATYLINELYWALPNHYHSSRLMYEEDFEAAVKLHRAGTQFLLPGLAEKAKKAIEHMMCGQLPIHFIVNTFKRFPVWCDVNAKWIKGVISLRARAVDNYSLTTDLGGWADKIDTGSPVMDGILEGLVAVKGLIPGVEDDILPYEILNEFLN
ncbi:hypothetical protein DER45DRAFT_614488 [Fusarium avenaceum]|nr:hypothetical protein DER45DRAFT_614488 [Fusarium avenaceum]